MNKQTGSELTFVELIMHIWSKKLLLLLGVLLGATVGIAVSLVIPQRFTAESVLQPPVPSSASQLIEQNDVFNVDRAALFSMFRNALLSDAVLYSTFEWYRTNLESEVSLESFSSKLSVDAPPADPRGDINERVIKIWFEDSSAIASAEVVRQLVSKAEAQAWLDLQLEFSAMVDSSVSKLQSLIEKIRQEKTLEFSSALVRLVDERNQLQALLASMPEGETGLEDGLSVQLTELPPYLMQRDLLEKMLRYTETEIERLKNRENPDDYILEIPSLKAKIGSAQRLTLNPVDGLFYRYSVYPYTPDTASFPHRPLVIVVITMFIGMLAFLGVLISGLVSVSRRMKVDD